MPKADLHFCFGTSGNFPCHDFFQNLMLESNLQQQLYNIVLSKNGTQKHNQTISYGIDTISETNYYEPVLYFHSQNLHS